MCTQLLYLLHELTATDFFLTFTPRCPFAETLGFGLIIIQQLVQYLFQYTCVCPLSQQILISIHLFII